jgi:predicted O-methyltransferase YrrM
MSRATSLVRILPILAEMRPIEGWFSDEEADLLAAAVAEAVRATPAPHYVVEVGSYCGRSTVVIGRVLQILGGPGAAVYAVDPHEGLVGAIGEALWSSEPTLDRFSRVIQNAGLDDLVRPVVRRLQDVAWTAGPIGLVLVDGLHDYVSVMGDVTHLDTFLPPGALLACHDYANGHPGVDRAVDQLTGSGCFELVDRAGALVVLRKLADLGVPPVHPLVERAATVDGWYSREELAVLAWTAARAVARPGGTGAIVEVGCHVGQATSVLAGVADSARPSRQVHVVDPFDGLLGGVGEQLWQDEPTYDRFASSMRDLGIEERVVVTRDAAPRWRGRIRFLLVNHLHDYGNAATDLRHFEPHLSPDATVAFHNYADYWPGVRTLVDELVASGRYAWVDRVGALAVLRRVPDAPGHPVRQRRFAVVTMVADEAFFLPIWLRYYRSFADAADIYVLDHDSADGSTDGPGFQRIPVQNPVLDWAWHVEMVRRQQAALLERYDVVLCTDVDEIVVPDPAYGDLGRYVAEFSGDFVTCRGWEVLHDPATEPALDPLRPVLEQRNRWFRNPAYSKPLLATVPMPWTGGFHGRTDGLTRDDPRLFLVHLHRVDFDRCLARHRQRVARPWVPEQVAGGWGRQNRITDLEAFRTWFFTDSSWPGTPVAVEDIPGRWRTAF